MSRKLTLPVAIGWLLASRMVVASSETIPNQRAATGQAEAPKPFVMAATQPDHTRQGKLMSLIYHDLFHRIGVPLRLVHLPLKRASQEANQGKIDGEVGRIYEYSQIYTNMRRVEFPVVQVSAGAFARRMDKIKLNDGWDSLYGTPYSIGYQRGIVSSEVNLKKRVPPGRLSPATSVQQGILKLKYGRTDLFVHSHGIVADNYLTQEEFKDIEVIAIMQVVPIYPYVYKKHQAMAAVMADTLQQMKREGVLYQFCMQAYAELAANHCYQEGGKYSQLQW
ncbi:Bacterial extracellular solute-binding proteins, family 3 [Vibrio aerogenes CECT 7868]|uniref:Bacterial extracellular solute-binding proteins, family 3 n=1 Tax=Vibrio aerogenes CECT 7868 TaxID=1216006 RepID=A0A1M6DK23_9VIBR|nr:transporter substrate-binding domain-containing protein [Vibrio aerogenes]SHI73555.1 Bacterial extracellular solute-binding proteins, family 3 [Vibrio aerogenes CECT 7868]